MQPSNNAGIITYRETKVPQLLSLLALPKLDSSIAIAGEEGEMNIYFFDCPVNGEQLDKKRYKLLRELVDKSKASFLVERFETKVKSNVAPKKNELHYSQLLAEVKAIKQLAAVIKLSEDRKEELLKGNIGFVMGEVDSTNIDILSEEATNVMVYEGPFLTEQQKDKLHKSFMEKKGVSIVFSRDINNIILNSSILVVDEAVDLSAYLALLHGKIILGNNKVKLPGSIDNIILWTEELNKNDFNDIPTIYNNEIIAIMRYYFVKLDIIDFIKKLPYIYFNLNK